jgi:predicted ribosomally synthesized peptide with SipW-like signal peptide
MEEEEHMTKTRKLLVTLLVVGVVGTLAGLGTFSAFSSTTQNTGNSFDAGTVYLSDNDGGSVLYGVSGAKPGTTVTKCIKVTYTGTLDADVHLYTLSTINAIGSYIDLSIDRGHTTGADTFPNCTTFVSDSNVYAGTLGAFATAKNSYANGINAYPLAQTKWGTNDYVVYRFTLTMQDNNGANGGNAGAMTSGLHDFTWEARNQ